MSPRTTGALGSSHVVIRVIRAADRLPGRLRGLASRILQAVGARARPADTRMRERRARMGARARPVYAPPGPHDGRSPQRIDPIRGRILHLVERSVLEHQLGGTLRTRQVLNAQVSAGLDPHVLVLAPVAAVDAVGSPREVDGVPHHGLPQGVVYGGTAWPIPDAAREAMADLVERIRPAAVHAVTPFHVGRTGIDLARRFGLPVVYEVRGFREETWLARDGSRRPDAERYRMTREADTACMHAADAVVTLGAAMCQEIAARGVSEERITVVPNAVDGQRFRPGERDPSLAKQLGIGPDDAVVGSISSFGAYEGFETLVDAIAILRERGLGAVRGLLVGDGPALADIERRVAERGLTGIVLLPGRVKHAEVTRYHHLLDVFVVPRIPARVSELVTPFKPFEAMASGRAVVVSDLRALREIVTEGRTGLSFPAGDARALATVLERLVTHPHERRRLGEAARAWVLAERTVERNGARYRELYERLGAA